MVLNVQTHQRCELLDITRRVEQALHEACFETGLCLIYCPHTTAGITINENADPDVSADLLDALDRIVPQEAAWRHVEGNSPAHVKASLMGTSASVAVAAGRLRLGRWQGIFLCEFDGPRSRQVQLNLIATADKGART